jgi:hypothetical protein
MGSMMLSMSAVAAMKRRASDEREIASYSLVSTKFDENDHGTYLSQSSLMFRTINVARKDYDTPPPITPKYTL